ncbi:hypothetical protein AOLI_G00011710 [Acnodon oligacanthus]
MQVRMGSGRANAALGTLLCQRELVERQVHQIFLETRALDGGTRLPDAEPRQISPSPETSHGTELRPARKRSRQRQQVTRPRRVLSERPQRTRLALRSPARLSAWSGVTKLIPPRQLPFSPRLPRRARTDSRAQVPPGSRNTAAALTVCQATRQGVFLSPPRTHFLAVTRFLLELKLRSCAAVGNQRWRARLSRATPVVELALYSGQREPQ